MDPKHLQVNIKQSKTDPFRMGVKVWIGRTEGDLCQVAAFFAYMALRGSSISLLEWQWQKLVTKLWEVLQKVGIEFRAQLQDWSSYNGSSERDSRLSHEDNGQMGERCLLRTPQAQRHRHWLHH